MYGELTTLISIGPFSVTMYSLMMGLAFLLAGTLTIAVCTRKGMAEKAVPLTVICTLFALFGGHFAYACAFFPALEADYGGYSFFVRLHEGGYTLYGAVFFILLACLLLSRVWHMPFGRLMDTAAPGSLLALCIGRAAEYFNGQGLGQFVEEDGLRFFPFAVCTYAEEDWSEWYVPVFAYEAVTALVILAVVLLCMSRHWSEGTPGITGLVLLSCTQIFWEQMRVDELIRFGFVRFSQLCALACLMVCHGIRLKSLRQDTFKTVRSVLRFVASTLCIIFTEFAFEKPQFYPYLSAGIVLLAVSFLMQEKSSWKKGRSTVWKGVLVSATVASAGIMLYILTLGLENEWDYLFALMAVCCAVMGYESCPRGSGKEASACIE